MSYQQLSYENEDLWREANITEADRERVRFLATLIPTGARSVLDAGCGNGIFVHYLSSFSDRFIRLCGIDTSESALSHVKTEKYRASLDSLPFRDSEFDVVAALEVIEHLPLRVYTLALEEMCRVSSRYVLISVPNEEEIERALVRCPECFTRFNPDFHLRSFSKDGMTRLLLPMGYRCIRTECLRPIVDRFILLSRILDTVKSKAYPSYAICPVCGFGQGTLRVDRSAELADQNRAFGLRKFIKAIWPKRYRFRWVAALYERGS